MGPDTWGTSLAPNSFTCTVTSGPVSWFGVGARIWMRASVAGRAGILGAPAPPLPDEQPASAKSRTETKSATRLMGPDDTARSPVLGRTGPSPAAGCPRAAPAATHRQGPGGHQEGRDGDGQGGLGRARAAVRTAAAGGFAVLGRRGGGAGADRGDRRPGRCGGPGRRL